MEHFEVGSVRDCLQDRERAPRREEFRGQLFGFPEIALPLDTEPIE